MPRILVYGDSNSWGYQPLTGRRFAKGVRWPTVMHALLGPDWELVEEALNGRTTVLDDPTAPHRNGLTYLAPCLLSHEPLDVVVIALGVNDLKRQFSRTAAEIADGAGRLVKTTKALFSERASTPQIVLVAPAPLARLTLLADEFAGGTEVSRELKGHFERVADSQGVQHISLGDTITLSDLDGIHMDADAHMAWGRQMAEFVARLTLTSR